MGNSTENRPASPTDPCAATILHCESYGNGDPIIALHGLGGTLFSWRNLTNSFPHHQLILVDMKGAGDSPKPRDDKYSIADQAELILQLIRKNDLQNVTLMGNSYGGALALFLAIELCKEKPSRLAFLILLDAGGYAIDLPSHLTILRTPVIGWLAVHLVPPRKAICKVLKDSYYDRSKITNAQITAYARPLRTSDGKYALLRTAKQAVPKNIDEITAQYKNINVPTLIIWGLNDRIVPLKIGAMLKVAIKPSTFELIDQCGHVPQEEKPKETIDLITQFFRQHGQEP